MLAALGQLATDHPSLALRLRLFGLLLLLVPLFAGLQRLVTDAVPQVEVQFVSDDRPTPVPVERTVERIIYVPVPAEETPEPATPAPSSATPGTGLGKP
jgi:hypothetical protein